MKVLFETYSLIHTLGKGERRYFSLLCGALAGAKGSTLLRLFEVLKVHDTYDEAALLGSREFVACGKGVRTQLQRLKSLLLKVLIFQHGGKEKVYSGLHALRKVEILFERGLSEAALRVIRRNLLPTIEYGEFEIALSLLNWEARIKQINWEAYGSQKVVQDIGYTRQNAEYLRNCVLWMSQLRDIHWQMRQVIQVAPRAREAAAVDRLAELAQDALAVDMMDSTEMLLKSYAVDIRGMWYLIRGEHELAYQLYEKLMGEWDDHQGLQQKYSDFYLLLFKNYQNAVVFGSNDPEIRKVYLDRLAHDRPLMGQAKLDYQRIRYQHILTVGLNSGDFALVHAHADEIREWLFSHRNVLPPGTLLAFLYNLTLSWFFYGEHDKAYSELQHILNWEKGEIRRDIRSFARVLQLILLYELGHHDLNEYLSRSANRYLRQQKQMWPFELPVARYMRRADPLGGDPGDLAELERLKKEIDRFRAEAAQGYPVTGLSETSIWIQSKLEGRHIREVILELIHPE